MSLWLKSGGWWRIHAIEIPGYVIEKRKRRLRKNLARKRQRFNTLKRKQSRRLPKFSIVNLEKGGL
jgi:sugar-specific transcriptional regulator TrmB